jgi:GNAT superfamily N-acetyltransferase
MVSFMLAAAQRPDVGRRVRGFMQVRQGTPNDRDSIVAFDRIAQSDVNRATFIERALLSGACAVADQDGSVVGYAVLEYTFYNQGFVSMLYVAEPARRRGVGRALMREVGARCGTLKLFTSTNESNGPMRALLASLGYVPSGVIHNLEPGDPELVYFLDLSERAA